MVMTRAARDNPTPGDVRPEPVGEPVLMFVRELAHSGGSDHVSISARILRNVLARMDRNESASKLVSTLTRMSEPTGETDDAMTVRSLIAWARVIEGCGPAAVEKEEA